MKNIVLICIVFIVISGCIGEDVMSQKEPVRKLTESEKAEIIEIALKNTTVKAKLLKEYKIIGLSRLCIAEDGDFISFDIEDIESAKNCTFSDERKVQKILPGVTTITGIAGGYDKMIIITVNLGNKAVEDIFIVPLPVKGTPIPPS